jgi:hypothetical protein
LPHDASAVPRLGVAKRGGPGFIFLNRNVFRHRAGAGICHGVAARDFYAGGEKVGPSGIFCGDKKLIVVYIVLTLNERRRPPAKALKANHVLKRLIKEERFALCMGYDWKRPDGREQPHAAARRNPGGRGRQRPSQRRTSHGCINGKRND